MFVQLNWYVTKTVENQVLYWFYMKVDFSLILLVTKYDLKISVRLVHRKYVKIKCKYLI